MTTLCPKLITLLKLAVYQKRLIRLIFTNDFKAFHVSSGARNAQAGRNERSMPSHVPLPVRSFIARWVLRFWHSRSRSLQVLAILCTSSWIVCTKQSCCVHAPKPFAKDYRLDVMNAPLPAFDMMTGQPIVSAQPVPASAAAATMLANDSDVVHVQLLDRMIVVPRAVVNVSVSAVSP